MKNIIHPQHFLNASAAGWVLLLVLCLSGCFVTRTEGDQMLAEISQLKNEIAVLQRDKGDLQSLLDGRLKELHTRTSEIEKVSFKKNADAGLENEKVAQELEQLKGKLEETQHQLEQVQKAKVAPDSEKPATEAAPAPEKKLENFFADGEAAFKKAKESKKASLKKENYKKAIMAYQEVLTRYPDSKKVPESLYKIGLSMEAMGYAKDAQVFFEEITTKHAKSSFAKEAMKRLKKKTP